MPSFPAPVARLIEELRKLPGIGSKSAQRLVFHLVARPADQVRALAAAVADLEEGIRPCSTCHQITDEDPCAICRDHGRDTTVICVVENPSDVLAVEAVHIMEENKITALLVADEDNRLIGALNIHDLFRAGIM